MRFCDICLMLILREIDMAKTRKAFAKAQKVTKDRLLPSLEHVLDDSVISDDLNFGKKATFVGGVAVENRMI